MENVKKVREGRIRDAMDGLRDVVEEKRMSQ